MPSVCFRDSLGDSNRCSLARRWLSTVRRPEMAYPPPAAHIFANRMVAARKYHGTFLWCLGFGWVLVGGALGEVGWCPQPRPPACRPPARLPAVHIFAVSWGPPDLSPPTDTAREYCVNFELWGRVFLKKMLQGILCEFYKIPHKIHMEIHKKIHKEFTTPPHKIHTEFTQNSPKKPYI